MQPASASHGARTSSLRTPLCDLFGIEVPICLAGMGGVSMAPLKNPYVADYEADPSTIKRFPEQLAISSARQVMAYWNPEADPARTCMPAGQGVGSFHDIRPAGEVLRAIVAQAEAILRRGVIAPASV